MSRAETDLKITVNVHKRMKERGLTPAKIEKYIPISERTLYRIMKGEKMPTIVELAYLAGVLNLSIQDLVEVEWRGRDLLNKTTEEN